MNGSLYWVYVAEDCSVLTYFVKLYLGRSLILLYVLHKNYLNTKHTVKDQLHLLVSLVSYSAQAAITKYFTLRGLNNRKIFFSNSS